MNALSITLTLAAVSFLLTVIWGGPLVRILLHLKIGDSLRMDALDWRTEKIGTPTMGGVMFIIPVLVITLVLNAVSVIGLSTIGRSVLLPLGAMVAFAILGSLDDWQKFRNTEKGEGMPGRIKFALQILISLAIAYVLQNVLRAPELYLPGLPREVQLGWFYYPVAIFIILSTTNAVNFTDGMDGLAGLISATAFVAYGGIALMQGQVFLAQFCFIVVGAVFGFLWFNVHPAMLIMGDTGSMALGATLGVVALMTGHWILIPIIVFVPTMEVVSVILQVFYFKATGGRRIFKMAPIHHHFELSGWSETQIVQRFWLVSLLFTMVGVALAVL